MSSISRRVAVTRCSRPGATTGEPGSVTSTTSAASGCRARRPRARPRASRSRPRAPCAPRWRRGRRVARSSGCELGDAAQQVRQLRLAAEEAHAHVLELGRVRRLGDRRLAGRPQLADPLVHRAAILRLHSYRATVAAIAAFSDSAATGIVAVASHAAITLCGSPSRSAPTTSVTSPSTPASGSPPWATSAIRAARQLARLAHAHDRDREQRAHRRPHGLVPVRVGGAGSERHAGRPERQRAAQRGADVAGVVDAPQRQAQRPGRRRRPALPVHAERARARAELRDLGEQVRLDLVARRGPSPPRRAAPAAPSRRRRRRPAGPRPRPRTGAACPATCGPRACGPP